ncbi:MAG: NTP transferase domain-containing protein [Spirochaetales bacterium]|nr:NTP transferase domain-containing protein [Spirochaetales bacterium]
MEKVAAIVLAGDKRGSISIRNDNKAFLPVQGKPILVHILRALGQSPSIGKIAIVGPEERIRGTLDESSLDEKIKNTIRIVPQRENLLENSKSGFLATLESLPPGTRFNDLYNTDFANTSVLLLSSDMPLLTSYEIDEFLKQADMEKQDYFIGITSEKSLSRYLPDGNQPGVSMIYFNFKEGRLRQNNLHIAKPLKVKNLKYLEIMYELRYQTRFRNILLLIVVLCSTGGSLFSAVRYTLNLQISRLLRGGPHHRLYRYFKNRAPLEGILRCIGKILGTRIGTIETHYGGAALDIDNEKDLEIVEKMYEPWIALQQDYYNRLK